MMITKEEIEKLGPDMATNRIAASLVLKDETATGLFCQKMSDAWRLVQRLGDEGWLFNLYQQSGLFAADMSQIGWLAEYRNPGTGKHIRAGALSAPLAICSAACLVALEVASGG